MFFFSVVAHLRVDTDSTSQSDPQSDSDSANDEYSASEASSDSLADDVRSLTDRSVTETIEEHPAEIVVATEVQPEEGLPDDGNSSSKKSKKASKLATRRALFE